MGQRTENHDSSAGRKAVMVAAALIMAIHTASTERAAETVRPTCRKKEDKPT